jgi:alpha 1,3-glucosidase
LYTDINFELQLDFLKEGDGIARIRVDEVDSKLPWKRYDEASKWALLESEPTRADVKGVTQKTVDGGKTTVFTYGPSGGLSLEIEHEPLRITFKQGGEAVMVINDRNLFHMEHFRLKEDAADEVNQTLEGGQEDSGGQTVLQATSKPDTTWFEGEPDSDAFEEKWKSWTDSKPKGLSQLEQ